MEELYLKYKDVSLHIIEDIENDNLANVTILMDTRKKILDQIKETVNMDKLDNYYSDMISLDNEINCTIIKAREAVKSELIKLKKQKNANSIYGKQFTDIYFLNKQI